MYDYWMQEIMGLIDTPEMTALAQIIDPYCMFADELASILICKMAAYEWAFLTAFRLNKYDYLCYLTVLIAFNFCIGTKFPL